MGLTAELGNKRLTRRAPFISTAAVAADCNLSPREGRKKAEEAELGGWEAVVLHSRPHIMVL